MASYISKIQLPSGSEPYLIKDSEARTMINSLSNIVSGSLVICGETTTALTDGATTSPVKVKYAVPVDKFPPIGIKAANLIDFRAGILRHRADLLKRLPAMQGQITA